jgi:hypothetical protein
MDLVKDWSQIRRLAQQSFNNSLHYPFATTNADGTPHLSPIGSLLLHRTEPQGVYFEIFTRQLPQNLKERDRVTIMAVNSSRWFWFKSLWRGKFNEFPALRLSGHTSERRQATEREIDYWQRRIKLIGWLKGSQLLWSNMKFVREIYFDSVEPVKLGVMTQELFQNH